VSRARFAALFGRRPDSEADAPGRVNLIGEHTDYNEGFVLPMAVPQRARVWLARREDRAVRFASAAMDGKPRAYELGREHRGSTWLDYVQGITHTLEERGYRIGGFDALLTSDVPIGAGLASSAALEVALLRALRQAFSLELDDLKLAQLGQRAENDFVGARVGIMDQMAANLADDRAALFIDTRTLAHERVLLPATVDVVVIHSGLSHDHTRGGYNERRAECEAACRRLGLAALRDIDPSQLQIVERLPEPLRSRARHVVTENARVLEAVGAIRRADIETLGGLLLASHRSMRDDYEVSTPEIDLLVELACGRKDVFGARLTGGGFGGSVLIVTRAGEAHRVARSLSAEYAAAAGQPARILVPQTDGREDDTPEVSARDVRSTPG
jgi:galactokinase